MLWELWSFLFDIFLQNSHIYLTKLSQTICRSFFLCPGILCTVVVLPPGFGFQTKFEPEERTMRNYQDSDYAVNKYSPNIVYRFADRTVEVTQEDYLRDNPDKTAEDFAELKALSDEMYHEQDLEDTRYGKRAKTLESVENTERYAVVSPDVELIHKADEGQALQAAKRLLESGTLTEVQKRRFILHYIKGYSTRQIAKMENVNHTSVMRALAYAQIKLKKFFQA